MARVFVEKFACSFALFEACKWLGCLDRGAITSEKIFESGQFSFGECSRHIQLPAIVANAVAVEFEECAIFERGVDVAFAIV
jgi:hypothetical protein